MSLTAAAIDDIFVRLRSHALSSGFFRRVNQHEPKNAPPAGLSAALWLQAIGPDSFSSSLDATDVRIEFNLRIYQDMLAEPQDEIDPAVLAATAGLMEIYSGAFTLGGTIKAIDLLGMSGTPLSARAGYLSIAGELHRVITITIPVLINRAWSQTA